MTVKWKWTTRGERTIAHDAQGAAQAIVYRQKPGVYSVERAVVWPGGMRDWRVVSANVATITAAKALVEKA